MYGVSFCGVNLVGVELLAATGVITSHAAALCNCISFILGVVVLTFRFEHFETMETMRCATRPPPIVRHRACTGIYWATQKSVKHMAKLLLFCYVEKSAEIYLTRGELSSCFLSWNHRISIMISISTYIHTVELTVILILIF